MQISHKLLAATQHVGIHEMCMKNINSCLVAWSLAQTGNAGFSGWNLKFATEQSVKRAFVFCRLKAFEQIFLSYFECLYSMCWLRTSVLCHSEKHHAFHIRSARCLGSPG